MNLVLEGVLTPDQVFTYPLLPFDVPEGVGRIDVTYTYDAAIGSDPTLTGGNTLDIGIFDPRGSAFMGEGYRGWSGSARSSFFIAQDEATPGYMPGSIQAGTWHIFLGGYKIAPEGCPYRVEITLIEISDKTAVEFPALLRLTDTPGKAQPNGWYKGELHCHTVHSDGAHSVAEVVRMAEMNGLDFLAITDHNNRTQGIELGKINTSLILIPGYEVTTYYGHWNIWGDMGWIDFRIQSEADMESAIAEAVGRGFLVSCNHPRPYGPDWAFPQVEGYDCVEVWNGAWAFNNEVALEFWESRLRQGKRFIAVGGSDFHRAYDEALVKLATPTTYIYCPEPPSNLALLRGLRAGHAFITESPQGAQLYLSAGDAMIGDTLSLPENDTLMLEIKVVNGIGAQLQLVGSAGVIYTLLIEQDHQVLQLSVDTGDLLYVRAQLIDPESQFALALTNPIYFLQPG